MKMPIFAVFTVLASAVVAESQMPESVPEAAVPGAVAADTVSSDEILLGEDDCGRVELTAAGNCVNIVCEDATIADVLKQFRRIVKANILSSDSTNLYTRVSISLYDAPWVDSLKAILGMGGFALDERNGIYFVTPEQVDNPVVRTKSFELNHANADELAKLLNESFGEKDRKTGKVMHNVASVFKDANVIVVQGTDKMIRNCEEVITSVDRAPEQVYIEARFIELSSESLHKLGIDWSSLEHYKIEAKNLKAGFEHNYGRLGNYGYNQPSGSSSRNRSWGSDSSSGWTTDADGKVTPSGSGSSSSSSGGSSSSGSSIGSLLPSAIPESVGLLDAVGGTEQARSMQWESAMSFSGQLSADNFALALSAFENMSDAKIFSNPRIIVSNGKKAQVDMTTKYPNVRVTSNRTGGISDSLDITAQLEQIPGEDGALFAKEVFFSWGIALEVIPRIAPDGLINVEIIPSISKLDSWAEVQGGEGSAYSKYPVIGMQRLVTDFTMKDGSTAVIGGLTQTTEEDVDTGIPYLRKIPWIGQKLFGWTSRQKVQKEIIVFVTVGIANPRKLKLDAGLPKNAVLGREYVEGRAQEPGDRGGVGAALKLDMRTVDERREAADQPASSAPSAWIAIGSAAPAAESPVKAAPAEDQPASSAPSAWIAIGSAAPAAEAPVKAAPAEDQPAAGPRKEYVPAAEPAAADAETEPKLRHGRR